jgi:hypothetical protein
MLTKSEEVELQRLEESMKRLDEIVDIEEIEPDEYQRMMVRLVELRDKKEPPRERA